MRTEVAAFVRSGRAVSTNLTHLAPAHPQPFSPRSAGEKGASVVG